MKLHPPCGSNGSSLRDGSLSSADLARVLITGGAGYVGSHCAKLHDVGHECVVFDSLVKGHRDFVRWRSRIVAALVLGRYYHPAGRRDPPRHRTVPWSHADETSDRGMTPRSGAAERRRDRRRRRARQISSTLPYHLLSTPARTPNANVVAST